MSLPEAAASQLRIGVLSSTGKKCDKLKGMLKEHGMGVVTCRPLGSWCDEPLDEELLDVLLVDLNAQVEGDADALDQLMLHTSVPIFFNDASTLQSALQDKRRGRRLMLRLSSLAGLGQEAEPEVVATAAAVLEPIAAESNSGEVTAPVKLANRFAEGAARRVWVLGASIGGPPAVKRFLRELPADIPAAFILAQHIGASFVPLLAEQLNRNTELTVKVAETGELLTEGQVIVVPVEYEVVITAEGYVSLRPARESLHLPSIDHVMEMAAGRYAVMGGTILFSGMGGDAMSGCQHMASEGAPIWTQRPDSCVVSTMVDGALRAGVVSENANVEELAQRLTAYLDECESVVNESEKGSE